MTRLAAPLLLAAVGAAFVLAPAFGGPAKGKPRVKTTKRAIASLEIVVRSRGQVEAALS